MNKSDGCLGWIVAIIAWFILWGMCMKIGDTYNISPFIVLLLIVVVTIIVAVIGIYIHTSSYNRKYNKHYNRVNQIKQKYGLAYKKFVDEYNIKKDYKGNISELSELQKISCREDAVWEEEEKKLIEEKEIRDRKFKLKCDEWKKRAERIKGDYPDAFAMWKENVVKKWPLPLVTDSAICDDENVIKTLDHQIKYNNWQKEQFAFAKQCRDLRDELLDSYGCYTYNIQFDGFDKSRKYKIWQFFANSFCLEEGLDLPPYHIYKNSKLVKEHKVYLPSEQADAIAAYINRLNNEEKTNVYFCPTKDGWDPILYHTLYTNIITSFDNSVDFLDMSNLPLVTMKAEQSDIDKWISSLKRRIIIIDLVTDYNQLMANCKDVIEKTKEKRPLISFISIQKGLSREEITEIIDSKRKKRKEEAKRALEEVFAQSSLVNAVSSWDTLACGLHYSYLFYYYPVTCELEPTQEEWSNRWTIWDFKNTPGKISDSAHSEALDKVIPMLKEKLLTTFKKEWLKYLTLVCIPASSQLKTQARYEEFSKRICSELGMINAYPYITNVTEKVEKRFGGSALDINNLSFDESFFKGKYVLLFDDIITKGESMKNLRKKMEDLGATVVGGISLGKTKHERPI